jgi:hypothetical protein
MGLLTATQIKAIVSIETALDPSFFTLNIDYAQEKYLKPLLTADLYDAYVLTPLDYPDLTPLINEALAYLVAFISYEKDLERNISNQGVMENNTQYSKSATESAVTRVLAKIKQREFDAMERLGCFLIDNYLDYPLFDKELIYYNPNFNRFFIL